MERRFTLSFMACLLACSSGPGEESLAGSTSTSTENGASETSSNEDAEAGSEASGAGPQSGTTTAAAEEDGTADTTSGTDESGPGGSGTTGSEMPGADEDFAQRCEASGVLVCRGFDDASELEEICCEWETGAEANGAGSMDFITVDAAERTSGAGALRFEIQGQTGANHSGAFRQLIGEAFGPGTDLYVQYRLRLSPEVFDLPGSPKFSIFHHQSATCNDVEWTMVMNDWYDNIPTMYTHCGAQAPGGPGDGTQKFQEGDYVCPYGSDFANDPSCLKYSADRWMTFYFHVAVGEWGTPTSHLEAWHAVDGQAYEQWIDDSTYTLDASGQSVPGFDSVYLTTYITGKDSSIDHDTAYVWYDELIISSEPIAAPSN